jgi:hypothetical protein
MSLGSIIYIAGYTMLGLRSWADGARIVRSVVPADWTVWLWWPADAPAGCADRYPARLTTSAPPAGVAHLAAAQNGAVAGLLASLGALRTLHLMVVVVGPGHLAWRLSDSLPAVVAGQLAHAPITRCHGRPTVAGDATSNWCRLGAVYALWTEPRLPGPGRGARASVCVRAVPRERWVTGAVCSYK